jgi:NADH pyrophosphatase NudC (nudix superfamily)
MLGFFAEAATTEIVCGSELADVRWFSVEETRRLLERLSTRFPHLDTIARRLIRAWLIEEYKEFKEYKERSQEPESRR